jgi:cbb3-type cytochrome oxidase maturation protein
VTAVDTRRGPGAHGALRLAGRVPHTRWFILVFSVVMVLTAGTAFLFKLIEFIRTATTQGPAAMGSFLIPVLNYLMVAAGFAFLFLWAYLSGQFRDVESAKYRMLEMQEQIDREEAETKAADERRT